MDVTAMYSSVCNMIRAYDTSKDVKFGEAVIKNPSDVKSFYDAFYVDAAKLLKTLGTEIDKKSSKVSSASRVAALKHFVSESVNPPMRGIFQQDGWFVLCDGFRAVRLKEDLVSVRHAEEGEPVNMRPIFEKAMLNEDEMELPTIAEVKTFIAETGQTHSNKHVPMQLKNGMYVNPHYLLDFLVILPEIKAYDPHNLLGPIYLKGSNGEDGVLLPVRPRDKK